MSRKKIVIMGAAGRDFHNFNCLFRDQEEYEVVAFTVNEQYITNRELRGRPVVAFEDLNRLFPPEDHAMFVAMGFKSVNRARAGVYGQCKERGYELISYVCSKAVDWGEIEVGDNTFIFENNVIQPFVKIGSNVVLWSGNHIGHHAVIGDHCFITSHVVISGGTEIGEYCFLGVNATIRDHIVVAPSCVIGAGSIIMKNTQEEGVYVPPRTRARDGLRSSELDM